MAPELVGTHSVADEIETAKPNSLPPDNVVKHDYNPEDIHEAALADNPAKAERPSIATVLSIFFLGLELVAPISLGFIVATGVLVSIGTDLNDTADLGWVVSGWSIASSVAFSLGGSLSDIFGRRNVILSGGVIALVGSIVAATAKSLQVVIGGSTLLGFSCGLLLVAYAAVPELLANRYRALGLAWIEVSIVFPWATLAVLLGNLFVLHASWRWIYWSSAIYAGVCLIGTAAFYFPPARPLRDYEKSRWQQVLELDYGGMLLYIGGLTSVLLGLSWGGSPHHAWHSASVVAPVVVGGCGFIACFVFDFTVMKNRGRPLFPKHLMTQYREFTVSLIVLFISGMVYYSMSGLLPQGTLYVYTNDPIQIGVTLLPNGFGQFLTTGIIPMFIHTTKRPKVYILIALVFQTVFNGLYAYGIGFHKSAWMAFQFFGQGCFGLVTVVTVLNAGLHVRPSELGIAVGLLGTFRSMGGSVGAALFNSILRNSATTQLGERIPAAAIANGFTGNMTELFPAVINAAVGIPDAFGSVSGATPAVQQATLLAFKQAYAYAYRIVFYSTIPFGCVALVAAVFIADASKYMTNHVQVRLEKDVLKRTEAWEKDAVAGS